MICCSHNHVATINVASTQADITKFGADVRAASRQYPRVLSHQEMIAALQALKDEGKATNADISRVIKQPSSRVAELFAGQRMLKVDEMKTLIDHYHINGESAPAPSPESLEPILDALLPLAPPGPLSDQSRRALASALSYGLGLLGSNPAKTTSSDALAVAARAAVSRFREIATAS